jgi:predicted metalloprotease
MRLDDLPESGNIEDRRGESGGLGGGGGGLGGLPVRGGLGIGTIVVLGLVGWALGIDPSVLIGGAEMLGGGNQPRVEQPARPRQTGAPQDEVGRFVNRVLSSTDVIWKDVFSKQGQTYRAPTLVIYRDSTPAGCGRAQSAMGPFYCPTDQKVYLDTSFFDQIATRFGGCDVGSESCRFAQAYVIGHEIGHHVQQLLGILPKAHQAQQAAGGGAEANRIQVRVELQADCFAGVWAKRENDLLLSQGKRAMVEPGDVDAALRTAAAIGDDTLQKRAQGRVVPDSFTHGSSEQRKRWFETGFKGGTVPSCNTFAAAQL